MSRDTDDGDDTGWNGSRSSRHRGRQPSARLTRHTLGQKIAAWTSVALVGVLVAGSLVAYAKYRAYWDSIKRVDVEGLIGPQPPKYTNAENILVIGTDTRVGQDGIGGSTGCGCSDTLMLLHLSPGRHRVTVMSIPRETMVPVLACAADDGTPGQQAESGQMELINAALSAGGPACTWKTFEAVTNIHIDHFIELDFIGFEKVIDDLGGVNVCLPFPVDDSMSGLHLAAGKHHVWGTQALAFWRTREDLGYGSDTQRILRDQYLMVSLVQGIEHSGKLKSPSEVLHVVGDVTSAMTTDTGLDQNAMLQIADSVRGVKSSEVQFVTSPNEPYPANNNDVEFQQPQADELFNAIAHDATLPSGKVKKKKTRKSAATPAATTTPSQVKVDVENGSGVQGEAGQAGSDLTSRGFDVLSTGDANNFNYTSSVIEYAAPSDLAAVDTLKPLVSSVEVMQNPALTPGTIELIVGSSFSGLSTQPTPSASSGPAPSVASVSTSDGALPGNAPICKDQAAFAGPDS
jgi:LCP family protein required for cell wall assembly